MRNIKPKRGAAGAAVLMLAIGGIIQERMKLAHIERIARNLSRYSTLNENDLILEPLRGLSRFFTSLMDKENQKK